MRLLLDTHVMIWWLADDRKLKNPAREIIANPRNQIFASAVVVWEVAIKSALGRIDADVDEMEAAIRETGFEPLPVNLQHAARIGRLPKIHRDPFDRMLVAQASIEELRLVSNDQIFTRYSLATEGLPPIFV